MNRVIDDDWPMPTVVLAETVTTYGVYPAEGSKQQRIVPSKFQGANPIQVPNFYLNSELCTVVLLLPP